MGQKEMFEDSLKIKQRFLECEDYSKMAVEYGVTTVNFRFFLMGLGFDMSQKMGKQPKFNHEEALRLYVDEEKSLNFTARQVGTSVSTLRQMLSRRGIRIRRKAQPVSDREVFRQIREMQIGVTRTTGTQESEEDNSFVDSTTSNELSTDELSTDELSTDELSTDELSTDELIYKPSDRPEFDIDDYDSSFDEDLFIV